MKFTIMTLFPDQVKNFLSESIIGRASDKGIIDIECLNIRDFADNEYSKVDDTLYGGGTGMLMECEPVWRCYQKACEKGKPYVIYVSPKGTVEISIGDYVLTGGEIASVVIVDSVSRMIEGVLPNSDAYTNESHMNGTLEPPQYTKPRVWQGMEVPEVLLNGNQAEIDSYNRTMSLIETMDKRPDMFDKLQISAEDWQKVLAKKKQN